MFLVTLPFTRTAEPGLEPGMWILRKTHSGSPAPLLTPVLQRTRLQLLPLVHFMNQTIKQVLKHLLMELSHTGKYTQHF